jgi:ankyrin repeat protein
MLSRLLLLVKIASKHHSIFWILYNDAAQCNPHTAGDLLCTATKRDDIMVMKELLKQGVDVDSKDRHRLKVIQIAMAKNNIAMVNLLVGNGVDIVNAKIYEFPPATLNEILQRREVGHRITIARNLRARTTLKILDEFFFFFLYPVRIIGYTQGNRVAS